MQRGITKHFQVVHPKRELSSWKDQVKFEGSLSKLLDHLLVMTVQEKDCFPHFTRKDNSLLVWIIMLANTEETLPYRLSLTFKTGKNRALSQLMSCSNCSMFILITLISGPDTVTFSGKIYSTERPKSEFSSGRHGIAIPLDSITEYYDSRKKRYVKLDKISFTLTVTNVLLKDSNKNDPESGVEDID